MIAAMLPIHPKWCRLIASGDKYIEVRKRAPRIPTPYKAYLYCTKQKRREDALNLPISREEMLRDLEINGMKCMSKYANERVWAECVCDMVRPMLFRCSDPEAMATHFEVIGTGLSNVEIMDYLGNGKEGYGLHLYGLKIYDRPREITEFRKICPNSLYCESCAMYNAHEETCGNAALILRRPPQSWCYEEEIK